MIARTRLRVALVATLLAATAPAELVVARGSAEPKRTTAAAARTPDWSGVWLPSDGPVFDPTYRDRPENKGFSPSQSRIFPPYTPEYEARYAKIVEGNRRGTPGNDPNAGCLPPGMPRMMAGGFPVEFIVQPQRVIVLFEYESQRRIIYTDGRKHTPADELDPTFTGESIGRWEGDTLVVDTIGLRSEPTFDATGAMHSDALHLVERIRRVDKDHIKDRMTIEDPKAFTKPWEVTRILTFRPDFHLMDYYCELGQSRPSAGAPK